ncbi:MAG: DNA-binding protein [Oscillospiraceae bacterium]|nr:DNA-binding protein [Oscillospiraceae bacterium]MDE6087883.1 DNA-binding protein [Oscillospiraceae bacterium]
MAKNLHYVLLLDCYGELLTDRQRQIAELYYNEDFSLSEIAEMQKITRQAVRDSLRHTEQSLIRTEQKLGMAGRIGAMRSCLEQILAVSDSQQITQLARDGLELL